MHEPSAPIARAGERGASLVEVLIAAAILALVAAVVFGAVSAVGGGG